MALTGRLRKVRDAVWRLVCILVAIGLVVLGLLNVLAFATNLTSGGPADWLNLGLGVLFLGLAAAAGVLARHSEIGDP